MTEEDRRRQALLDARPPLDTVLNMHDFETVARTVLPEKAWVRVAMSLVHDPGSGAPKLTSTMTRHTTRQHRTMRSPSARTAWHTNGTLHPAQTLTCTAVALTKDYRVWFRPRILRDVSSVDWSTTILGQKSSLPLYIVRLTIGTLPR